MQKEWGNCLFSSCCFSLNFFSSLADSLINTDTYQTCWNMFLTNLPPEDVELRLERTSLFRAGEGVADSSRPWGMGPWSHLCFCGRCAARFLPVPGTSVTYRGKVQIQNGRLETRPFYSDPASDFIMVTFIKVITNLKSHQEKQIWTY